MRIRVLGGGLPAGVPNGAYPGLEAAAPAPEGGGARRAGRGGVSGWFDPRHGGLRVEAGGSPLLGAVDRGVRVDAEGAEASFSLSGGAAVLGLGAKMGPADRRGRRLRFWNTDIPTHTPDTDPLYASLPQALIVDRGTAFCVAGLWGGEQVWDVGRDRADRLTIRAVGGALDILVAAGPSPARAVRRLAALLGRPFLPPLWALGYQQSHWGYGDAKGFLAVARAFRDRGLPLDALYMDLDYLAGRRPLTWDRARFPDPAGFASELRRDGIRLVALCHGGVTVRDRRYAPLAAAGVLVKDDAGRPVVGRLWGGPTALFDFLDPRADAEWQRMLSPVLKAGVDGLWNDMNEPSFLSRRGPDPGRHGRTVPDDASHRDADGKIWRHREVHNLWALFMNRATDGALRRLRPGERPFILSRAGALGVGRYAALWTGDNHSWWEHLRASLSQVAALGLSGVAMAGVDIGGFQGEAGPELLARWIQAAALMPLCRNHSAIGSPRQEPYALGPDVERVARQAMRVRYALLPTLYALMHLAHRTGEPVWRPLGYGYPGDPASVSCEDEVMVGPDLLHAPVVEPGARSRRVHLPPGRWLRIDPGHEGPHAGGADHLAHAPPDASPLFARGGAVLVADPTPPDRARWPDTLEVRLFPGGAGRLTLTEDDGLSFAYLRGDFRRTELAWRSDAAGHGRLRVRRTGLRPGSALLPLPFGPDGRPMACALRVDGRPLPPGVALPGQGDLTLDVAPARG